MINEVLSGGGGGSFLPDCDNLQSRIVNTVYTRNSTTASIKGSSISTYSNNIITNPNEGVSVVVPNVVDSWFEVINEVGSRGILGSIVSPYLNVAGGIVDIEVTLDGVTKVYSFTVNASNKFAVIGSILSASFTPTYLADLSYSFYAAALKRAIIPTTSEQIAQGAHVVRYEDELKVRIKQNVALSTYTDRVNCEVIRRKFGAME